MRQTINLNIGNKKEITSSLLCVGHPFIFTSSGNNNRRQYTKWTSPVDEWNITSLPRSIVPHLKPRNGTHQLPMVRPDPNDEDALLERLKELKVQFEIYVKTSLFEFLFYRKIAQHVCCGLNHLILHIIHHSLIKH